jgi:hypothetical protein
VPNSPVSQEVLEKSVVKSAFSPDKSKLAYFARESEFLAFYLRDESGDHLLTKETTNERFSVEAGEIKWSGNNNWLIFSFKKGDEEQVLLSQTESLNSPLVTLQEILPAPLAVGDSEAETNPTAPQSSKNIKVETKKEEKKASNHQSIFYTWDDGGDLYVLSEGKILSFRLKDVASLASTKLADNTNGNLNNNENTNSNENRNATQKKVANNNSNSDNKSGEVSAPVASTLVAEKSDGFTFCGSYICSVSAGDKKIRVLSLTGNPVKEIDFSAEMRFDTKYQIFAYGEKLLAILDGEKRLFLWDETRFKEEGIGPITKIGENVTDIYFFRRRQKASFQDRQ